MPISPAAADRPRRADEALDRDRRERGVDRNRDAAGRIEPALSDEQSLGLPNTNNRKAAK
jgi:hypothetical protein